MNDDMLRVLRTVSAAFSNPVMAQVQDRNLKSTLTALERANIYVTNEMTALPELRRQALTRYATLSERAAALQARQGLDTESSRELARAAQADGVVGLERALAAAKEIYLELSAIASSEARQLQRDLLAPELDLSEETWRSRNEIVVAGRNPGAAEGTVLQAKGFDPKKLEAYIASTFPGERALELVESRFVSGGYSKYTLRLRLAGVSSLPEELILRGDAGGTFGGAPVQKEYELLRVLHGHGVRVPNPLAFEPSGTVFGAPFMLVELEPGTIVGHMFEMPQPNKTTCREVAEALARVHAVPLSALSGVRGAARNTVDQAKEFLGESLASWRALGWSSPAYEASFDWLQRNIGILERTRSLVHGDYGLNNLLIDNERVAAILDWEFAHIGNPAYDLGYFYYQADRLDSWDAFVQAYRAAGGAPVSTAELDYSTLFAVVRLGVMVCQSIVAFRNGQMPGLGGASALINNMHDTSINRIAGLLRRLL